MKPGAARPALAKTLLLRHLFVLAFGMIIGVGWITVMGFWLGNGGSIGSILAFVGGWFFMVFVVLCYAEIAAMYPVSGGEVAYAFSIYGLRASFLAGWFLAFHYISVTAFEAISVGWVLSALLPGIEGPVLYRVLGDEIDLTSLLVGLGGMAVITYVNHRGAELTAWFQSFSTYGLLAISAVFIVLGLAGGDPAHLRPLIGGQGMDLPWLGVLAVFITTPFWFAGFDIIPQAMGEKDAAADLRLLPRVMVGAITLALIFYLLIILASAMALPRRVLLGQELPTAAAFAAAMGSQWLGKLVLLGGLLGLISTWNAIFFGAARLIFALGRASIILPAFGSVHPKYHSPWVAVMFVGIVGGAASLLGRNALVPIVNIGATILSSLFFLISLGVILLRYRAPDRPRPVRLPGGLLIPGVALVFAGSMAVLSFVDPYRRAESVPVEWLLLGGWLVLGLIFWQVGSGVRRAVSESDRRYLMLDEPLDRERPATAQSRGSAGFGS